MIKHLALLLLVVFGGHPLSSQATSVHDLEKDEHFENGRENKAALNYYAQKAQESQGEAKKRYLELCFKAFPRDFKSLLRMHAPCYGDTLYLDGTNSFSHNPWSPFHFVLKRVKSDDEIPEDPPLSGKFPDFKTISYGYMGGQWRSNDGSVQEEFNLLEAMRHVIPEEIYYEKMLSVGIGGFWDADDIAFFRNHLWFLLADNLCLTVKILSPKTSEEIASLFYFLYDGPHPNPPNIEQGETNFYDELCELSAKLGKSFKMACDQLLSEQHCPGH